MTTITLEFTDEQFERIQRMATEKRYADPERFIESLVETSLRVDGIENLEGKLKEGFDSELSDWTPQDLEDIRREGKKLVESHKTG